MKLREQGGRRGGRKSFLSAAEAVGRPEVTEPVKFKWIEIQREKDTLAKLFAALKDSRQEEPERGNRGKALRKDRLRLAFYLSVLCQGHPELQMMQADELEEIAVQRMDDDNFSSDWCDYSAVQFSHEARQKLITDSDVDHDLREARTVYAKIEILFGVAIGLPNILSEKKDILTRVLLEEIASLSEGEGQMAVVEAAYLVLLYPEKRGEILNALTAEDVADRQHSLKLQASTLLLPNLHLSEAAFIASMLFEQQVLAAQDGKILPTGEIELTPPTKAVQTATRLPDRSLS